MLLHQEQLPVYGCGPAALTSTAGDALYIDVVDVKECSALITILNSTTVTGTAVTLLQAKDTSGTSAKALEFDWMWANADATQSTLKSYTKTAVTSDTFTSATTSSKALQYIVPIPLENVDYANGFRCIRVNADSAVNSVGAVNYLVERSYLPPV